MPLNSALELKFAKLCNSAVAAKVQLTIDAASFDKGARISSEANNGFTAKGSKDGKSYVGVTGTELAKVQADNFCSIEYTRSDGKVDGEVAFKFIYLGQKVADATHENAILDIKWDCPNVFKANQKLLLQVNTASKAALSIATVAAVAASAYLLILPNKRA